MRSTSAAMAMLVIVVGVAIAGVGLYLLAEEISGDLTPLLYFALIGVGWAAVARGIRVYRDGR